MSEQAERVGICWADIDTFWWDATNTPICPVCSEDDEGYADLHGFFVHERRAEAEERERELLAFIERAHARVRELENIERAHARVRELEKELGRMHDLAAPPEEKQP